MMMMMIIMVVIKESWCVALGEKISSLKINLVTSQRRSVNRSTH